MSAGVAVVPRTIDGGWAGVDGSYGGYPVGLLADAAVQSSRFSLVSLSANFVAHVKVGEVSVEVTHVHAGRSSELLRLALVQGDRTCLYATAELMKLSAPDRAIDPWIRTGAAGIPREQGRHLGRSRLPFDDQIDLRLASSPALSDDSVGWVRMRPEAPSPGLGTVEGVLALLMDAPTPGLFGEDPAPLFVPSVDYAVHFAPRADWAATDWVRFEHATLWATKDHCADEVSAWTGDGRLLAVSRQTRAIRWGDT